MSPKKLGRWGLVVGAAALLLWAGRQRPPAAGIASPRQLTSLADQEGKRFSFDRLAGHTVVMNFVFTHCPVSCPLQTRALTAVQRALPASLQGRVQFVSVSMDPARDTPTVLKQFALAMGAGLTGWSFVTGNDDEITWLHNHYNAQVKRAAGGQFDHRVAVYLLDANQNLIQTYTGDFDQARLAKEIGEVDHIYNQREGDRS